MKSDFILLFLRAGTAFATVVRDELCLALAVGGPFGDFERVSEFGDAVVVGERRYLLWWPRRCVDQHAANLRRASCAGARPREVKFVLRFV